MAYNVTAELFAEWAIGLVIIAIRIYARWKVGNGKFYWDDLCLWFATVGLLCLRTKETLLILKRSFGQCTPSSFISVQVCFSLYFTLFYINLKADVYGSNIGLNDKTAMEVPDSQVAALRTGSIDAFVAWISYVFMVWSFKGVLMFLYHRLTCAPRVLEAPQALC
jgi:hypothetical protein